MIGGRAAVLAESMVVRTGQAVCLGRVPRLPAHRSTTSDHHRTRRPTAKQNAISGVIAHPRPFLFLNSNNYLRDIMSADVLSSEAADITSSAAPRRRSGRVVRKPEKFTPRTSPVGSFKRKRPEDVDSEADGETPSSEEDQSDSNESEPDEEELKEQRRRSKKSRPVAKKPPQKKPKTNGQVSLPLRPSTSTKKKAPKPRKAPIRKSAVADDEADGLYGKFASLSWRLE